MSQSAHVGVKSISSLAYKKGIRTFDEVIAINGKTVSHWRDLEKTFYLLCFFA